MDLRGKKVDFLGGNLGIFWGEIWNFLAKKRGIFEGKSRIFDALGGIWGIKGFLKEKKWIRGEKGGIFFGEKKEFGGKKIGL